MNFNKLLVECTQPRANCYLTFENYVTIFPTFVSRVAPYPEPSVRENERPGVEVEMYLVFPVFNPLTANGHYSGH